MLNAFYVIDISLNENLEQHKRFGFLSHLANASLITHTDAAEIAFQNVAHVFIYTLTLCIRAAKVMLCLTTHFQRVRLVLHCSALGYEPKSNVIAQLLN